MKPRARLHWPVSSGCVPRSDPLHLLPWLLDASCPGLPFIVISRERSGSFSPEKEETVVPRGSQLGICSRDPPSEYNRADHQEGLAWCKCACVHVCTHTRVCCRLRLGEEFRVSAKEPGADTAGILLRSHFPLY